MIGRLFICKGINKENYGRGGSMPGHIINLTDGIISSVTPSKILLVFLTRHYMDNPV
jgi:hypothetical protein